MRKQIFGNRFDDEVGMIEEATAVAIKRVIARQIEQEMKTQKLTKSMTAKKMRTSHVALNRCLSEPIRA